MAEINGSRSEKQITLPVNAKTITVLVGVLAIAIALGLALYNFAVSPIVSGVKETAKPTVKQGTGSAKQNIGQQVDTSAEKYDKWACDLATSKVIRYNLGPITSDPKTLTMDQAWSKYWSKTYGKFGQGAGMEGLKKSISEADAEKVWFVEAGKTPSLVLLVKPRGVDEVRALWLYPNPGQDLFNSIDLSHE